MILTGLARLGKDAEVRVTPGNEPVASLALAFGYGKKGADGNRPAQWVEAALWGKRAEALTPYLKKGGLVSVTLSDPHIETYTDRAGGERSKMVARVLDLELAGGGQSAGNGQRTEQKQQNNAQQAAPAADNWGNAQGGGGDDFDDIPFANTPKLLAKYHLI